VGVLSGAGPVVAQGFDANGNLVAQAQEDARDPVDLHLSAPAIARVIVSGGDNEAVIFRICHGSASGEACVDFRAIDQREARVLKVSNLTLTPAKEDQLMTLHDVISDSDPVKDAPDGRMEMLIPEGGLILTPDAPLAMADLYIVTLGGARIRAVGFDADGQQIASAEGGGQSDTISVVGLKADGIARIEVQAGDKSFLTRVCTSPADKGGIPSQRNGLPTVVTRLNGQPQTWSPQLVTTIPAPDGGTCRIVHYDQPASVVDAPEFEIVTPAGNRVTLLSLCAVDSRADLARAEDQAAQAALNTVLTTASNGAIAVTAREILLHPGQDYRIEVDWSWQAWQSNEDGTDSPPPTPPDLLPDGTSAWTAGSPQSLRFRIASEDLVGGETQDGLNEYKFDPRDISRYLSRTEPADGRDVVFTDDPLWVHFNSGHVEALADRYGRKLEIWVRRTDPPPQPDAAAMDAAVFPILLETIFVKGPRSTRFLAEQRINDAVMAAPCLPDGPVAGGGSMGARFKLEKNAMYDFNLIAPKKGINDPALADPVIVNATRFKTSRYANPTEMLAALGFATLGAAPIAPQELILTEAMTLPTGALSVSDLDMGTALAGIGADTLPLPGDQGRVIALWRHLGSGVFGVAGVLVDAPEPMRRVAAVLQGQQAVDAVRCEPARMALGSTNFLPVRATLNWTRVLFVAPTPVTPIAGAALSFRLSTGIGGSLTGRRIINARPVMLDTEGF
jgi:hypothetical protein